MRLHRQQLRRWTALVLSAWLFGIVMSVANACAVRLPAVADGAIVEHASVSGHHHHGDDHDRDGGKDAAKANCLDFCDALAVAAKAWQPTLDATSLAWLPAFLISLVMPAPLTVRARPSASPPDSPGAPPIPIAFLRLAL
ncbi:hypothetical protein [Azohydromonas lata]|uniref:DUF2946 domain-containing protein n=1 Tax=Azohydromonas lata TaxID=45677 RepID=A0ABU5ICF3_9BURK|nr:hypothetical protein [Azohydromonas lata]MDZ5455643.1 hypothetical protein [Azohydromonas lata]